MIFFFNDTATTEIYTLSLHDALPIWPNNPTTVADWKTALDAAVLKQGVFTFIFHPHGWIRPEQLVERSEEHTSELQSPCNLVCRLLLEKKKKQDHRRHPVCHPRRHYP